MRVRASVHMVVAGVAVAGVTACREVTAPVRRVPAVPQYGSQPTKGAWTVTTLDDPGSGSCTSSYCSLRDAVGAAQEGDNISFKSGVSGAIALSATLEITKSVTIDGGGRITLDGASLTDASVVHASAGIAVLDGLTISHGSCVACAGGGISNGGGLRLQNSTVSSNVAGTSGGGGIENTGSLTIVASTIVGNSTLSGFGGGIGNTGTLAVIASTISDNNAVEGGGIYSNGGTVSAVRSTISSNSAVGGGAGFFADVHAHLTIASSTITGNLADATGSGGIQVGSLAVATVRNSIVAGNTRGGLFANDCTVFTGGTFTSFGYNIFVAPCTVVATDKVIGLAQVTSEVLDPALRANGGPTKTHALIERGLAVDAGYCPGETADQRGLARPYDDARLSNAADGCDIGAVEWLPPATKRSK